MSVCWLMMMTRLCSLYSFFSSTTSYNTHFMFVSSFGGIGFFVWSCTGSLGGSSEP